MDVFLHKCIDLLQKAFINAVEPCEALFMMDWCTFLAFKISIHFHYKAWKLIFFNITDCIRLKDESRVHLGFSWGWANHGIFFIFGWMISLIFHQFFTQSCCISSADSECSFNDIFSVIFGAWPQCLFTFIIFKRVAKMLLNCPFVFHGRK